MTNVRIIRSNNNVVWVYEGRKCINHGKRLVDHIFANKVQEKIESMGYESRVYGNETIFTFSDN